MALFKQEHKSLVFQNRKRPLCAQSVGQNTFKEEGMASGPQVFGFPVSDLVGAQVWCQRP